ncbi:MULTISPECIES: hypothetical protein [unclassified Novosphingobium]|uniref:hypothetical protein n=1 Tax=unclassified Novosphingobium TaxID=2644732 RepID=UPI000D304001|nr:MULTISPECIES: hypothetical protein [unclassified Novosphingobium]PTR06108.1 hypothetical protein C8K11_1222 [Novosphingobium sp. GV055]PUA94545.1 hypothetical protein C8K12_1222 [Novosphingobium sp. GV061]PUB13269.1 hypothetical protein C8K14_1222 [Novosphingobium sp. GV079]PUB38253.1 hypothetical protein C8K10_1222 [Novosphingobium sp. GV027]
MDHDAAIAIGTALAALGGLLERKGICTKMELAEVLGECAVAAEDAGPERVRGAGYLGAWAYMVKLAADGVGFDDD